MRLGVTIRHKTVEGSAWLRGNPEKLADRLRDIAKVVVSPSWIPIDIWSEVGHRTNGMERRPLAEVGEDDIVRIGFRGHRHLHLGRRFAMRHRPQIDLDIRECLFKRRQHAALWQFPSLARRTIDADFARSSSRARVPEAEPDQ